MSGTERESGAGRVSGTGIEGVSGAGIADGRFAALVAGGNTLQPANSSGIRPDHRFSNRSRTTENNPATRAAARSTAMCHSTVLAIACVLRQNADTNVTSASSAFNTQLAHHTTTRTDGRGGVTRAGPTSAVRARSAVTASSPSISATICPAP